MWPSEAVQLELVKNLPPLFGAIGGVAAAYFSYRTHATAKETVVIAKETKAIAEKTEHNTNHMKDELVAEVRKGAFAAGQKDNKENG